MKTPKDYLKLAKDMVSSPEVHDAAEAARKMMKTGVNKVVEGMHKGMDKAAQWWKELESHRSEGFVPNEVLKKKRSSPAEKRSSKKTSQKVVKPVAKKTNAKKPVVKKVSKPVSTKISPAAKKVDVKKPAVKTPAAKSSKKVAPNKANKAKKQS